MGVDGCYVDQQHLMIDAIEFRAAGPEQIDRPRATLDAHLLERKGYGAFS
jgi:hypothetical protein